MTSANPGPVPRPAARYLRYFLRLFLPVAGLVLAGTLVIHVRELDRHLVAIKANETNGVAVGRGLIESRLDAAVRDVLLAAGLPPVRRALDNPASGELAQAGETLAAIATANPGYQRIRWIDQTGWERTRVDNRRGAAEVVIPARLEYVGERRYFLDAKALNPGQVLLSPIDLSIENNEIARPYTPVMHIATPLADSTGRRSGVMVVNLLGAGLLDVFRANARQQLGQAVLLNRDGYWISSPIAQDEWGFATGAGQSFAKRNPEIWNRIGGADDGQFRDDAGLWTFAVVSPARASAKPPTAGDPAGAATAGERWISVSFVPNEALALPAIVVTQIWTSALLVLLGFAFGTYRLARSAARERISRDALAQLNSELEHRVRQRTGELEVALSSVRETESRFRGLVEQSMAGIFILQDGRFRYVNPAFAAIFGYRDPEDIVNRVLAVELVSAEDRERLAELVGDTRAGMPEQFALVGVRPDGQKVEVEIYPRRIEYQGRTAQIGLAMDVTERRRNEQKLRQAATVFESTREGVVMTDTAGIVQTINPAFTTVTGYAEDEVIGRSLKILKSGRQDEAFYRAMWASLRGGGFWQGELWNRRKNGEIYPEWLTISAVVDPRGVLTNYVGVFTDLTRVKKSEQEIARLAHYDALTGLPNRLLVTTRLESAIGRTHRRRKRGAVLHVDLDRFKDINDSLGHAAGDDLLKEVASVLKSRVRESDTLARLGADEFLVLLEDIDAPEDAAAVANVLIEQMRRPFALADGKRIHTGCSIGISVFPDDSANPGQLIQFADTALHQAKARGRGQFHFYTEALGASANERLALESALRHALIAEEFVLHYQPLIDLQNDIPIGAEVLVRWQRADGELVSPQRFIPLAEDSGLIIPLGGWILRTACIQAKAWLDQGLPLQTLAVNLSPRQLHQQNLVEEIASILQATGLPPAVLELELTESALAEPERGIEILLKELKALGVRLAIDDFGTGYSSLSYLKRFPIDKLKIDQSFVRDIPDDPAGMEIAATVVAMGRNLSLKVLAEGIETSVQREFLTRHGCQDGQGYLFSRPLPAGGFFAWYRENAGKARTNA